MKLLVKNSEIVEVNEFKIFMVNYELRVTSCELRITSYELKT